ncbi:MAG: FHA domain-containing protein [Deltaproteobacteria bacterium]|nr:FHA domain-containing protein [Deltaproteobacteria bacterium]
MLKLAIHDFEGRTHYVPLKDGEYSIGRDDANQICLIDRNVSRHHARVLAKNSQVWIENVSATYGTRFNNLFLRERTEVQPGDVIEVGDYKLELVNENGGASPRRDNALKDPGSQPAADARPASSQSSKGKAPDGATAIVNLADISSLLNKEAAAPSQAIAEAAQPRLVVESENLRGLELRITKTPVVIGRVRENADLVIDHRSISKEHARLTRLGDGTWQVLDLGSANGIKVNGEPYSKSEVRSGDRLELGHVSLRFLAAGAKAASGSVAPAAGGKKSSGALVLAGGVIVLVILGVIAAVVLSGKKGDEPARPTVADDKSGAEKSGAEKSGAEKPSKGAEDKVAEKAPEERPEPKAAEPKVAEPKTDDGAAKVPVADPLMATVQTKLDEGKYEEAAAILEAAKISNPGSATIAAKHAELQQLVGQKRKLQKAESELDRDPTKTLELAAEVLAGAPSDSPMRAAAASLVDAAKAKIRKKSAGTPPAPPRDVKAPDTKETRPPREEAKAPEPTGAKSGKELYDEAREALGSSEWDKAVSLGRQAIKSGYKKANTVLAKAYWGKGDKGNCLKYAQAAVDAGFDDAAMQSLLNKCQ